VFTTYNVVLTLHLLVVVFIVGPLVAAAVAAPRAVDEGADGLPALRSASRTFRVYGGASVLAPLIGSAMVGLGGQGDAWKFSQGWISAAWALYLVVLVTTLAVLAPATRKAVASIEAGESGHLLQGRMQAAGGIISLSITVIVVLMVFKPGS
jgi:hypothetical protein